MAVPPVLDILVYALVLSGAPKAISCEAHSETQIVCSNGTTATWDTQAGYASVNGIPVTRDKNGRVVFGNGITSSRTAFGWTAFTNGVQVRHDVLGGRPDAYLVNPDLICDKVSETKAACTKR